MSIIERYLQVEATEFPEPFEHVLGHIELRMRIDGEWRWLAHETLTDNRTNRVLLQLPNPAAVPLEQRLIVGYGLLMFHQKTMYHNRDAMVVHRLAEEALNRLDGDEADVCGAGAQLLITQGLYHLALGQLLREVDPAYAVAALVCRWLEDLARSDEGMRASDFIVLLNQYPQEGQNARHAAGPALTNLATKKDMDWTNTQTLKNHAPAALQVLQNQWKRLSESPDFERFGG